ncbi:MAG TPA: hypothetical protein VN605_04360 [Thermoanaerobaculia bacterium]|nr:hypothetical protein [Thermoanaerobaculia bacterium]
MKIASLLLVSLVAATGAFAQVPNAAVPIAKIADDAKAIDRVAEVSKRDLPVSVLRRIVDEDVDLLRGKRADGTYQYASYDRLEASRTDNSFSIDPGSAKDDRLKTVEMRGQFIYRTLLELPTRRMLVTKNRRLWIDHVDIEYIPQGSSTSKVQNVKVEEWLEPGQSRVIDLTDIARQATVRVFARADKEAGYSNLTITLIQAKIFDNPDSPFADAVASAKAIQRGLERSDIPSIRNMAQRMVVDLRPSEGAPAVRTIEVVARPTPAPVPQSAMASEALPSDFSAELQAIEDLLTGTDAERRQGMDRLHQLVRRTRK